MALLFALFSVITLTFVNCKVYDRCQLARELKHVHKFPSEQIPVWVCIAKHESSFNTSAVNIGSGDHGLFQISDLYWCSPPGNGFACNAPCSAFEDDDISDDVTCIRRIFKEHKYLSGNGFNAWTVYPLYCRGDVSKYVEGCFDNEFDNNFQLASSTAEPEDEDSVYEFPPLPTPPKNKAETVEIYHFPSLPSTTSTPKPITTRPVNLRLQNQISIGDKTTSKSYVIYRTSTTPKPFTTTRSFATLKPFFKETTYKSIYTFKSYQNLKQPSLAKVDRFSTTSKPYFVRPSTKSTRSYFGHYTNRPNNLQKSTTVPPLSVVFENVHSDHKREQKFYGGGNTEYSFLWKSNGAPVLLSFPHLLYGAEEYLSSVEGLHPDQELHETFVILEPTSGAPLKVAKRVQFNMFIRAVEDIISIENVTKALVPIFWIEESVVLDDEYVNVIKTMLLNTLKILEIIKWGLLGLGAVIVMISAGIIVHKN